MQYPTLRNIIPLVIERVRCKETLHRTTAQSFVRWFYNQIRCYSRSVTRSEVFYTKILTESKITEIVDCYVTLVQYIKKQVKQLCNILKVTFKADKVKLKYKIQFIIIKIHQVERTYKAKSNKKV